MRRRRAVLFLCFFIGGLLFLIGRLIQLQLVQTEHFSKHHVNLLEESVRQRSQEIVIDNGRGDFLDRNGHSLTKKNEPVLVLFPFLKRMNWNIKEVARIINVSEEELKETIEREKKPFVFGGSKPLLLSIKQTRQINELKIPGVFAVERQVEVEDRLAEQLIGIIGENEKELQQRYPDREVSSKTLIGLTGLQASFDEFLIPEGETKLVYHVDATGAPLFGINVKYVGPANPFYPVNIKTTLDLELQKMAENLVDKHQIKKGGLVILDIETNSVLALVSRPAIDRANPFDNNGINNMMLKQQIMGSVFKTVVAAAAIDHKLISEERMFDCSKKINGDPDQTYQHGFLNFKNSFARSCNNAFGELAKELKNIDSGILEKYAEKMSLVNRVGWEGDIYHFLNFRQFNKEEKGRVFLSREARNDDNFVALTGIGQHEVRSSPLAVANMMATIARGGKKEMVRVVSKIEYKGGTAMTKFKQRQIRGESLAPSTATKLQKLLREVVENEHGTGRVFYDLPFKVAGKSGTAETGKFIDDKQLHNKWFAGYFPYEKPKFALVTVNLDVFSDEGAVSPLFIDIVKGIYELEQKNGKTASEVEINVNKNFD